MIIQIKRYLYSKHGATLQHVAKHFKISEQLAEQLLDYWVQKNCVVKESMKSCQTSCMGCPTERPMLYRWIHHNVGTFKQSTQ